MATSDVADPELAQVAWNLDPLLGGAGTGAGGVEALLDDAQARAEAFAAEHRGRVAELDGPGLAAAMKALGELMELVGRAGSYAMLWFTTDTADPERGALLQRVQERGTQIETQLIFFDLEWAAVEDEQADALLGHADLDLARHHLRAARRYRPYLLSEPEERILAEKALTSNSAWTRLFEEQTAALEVELPGEDAPVALEVALSRLFSPDRDERRGTAEAVTASLAPGLRVRGYVLNTVLADKMVDDRLRGYPHWLAARNLANEASDASVTALVDAVRGRYEIARRWYRLKARLLGLDRLADYDRMASVTDADEQIPWGQAKTLVLDSFGDFSGTMAGTAQAFFDEARIDAPVRPGKRGGAFCSYTVPGAAPYVMLNYTARRRDVLTLAHELGHGIHAALARPQGVFHFATPLTLAETASVFGETLVFSRLLQEAPTPESRLGLLAESIEGSIATVFRQVAMNRFEHLAHTARREVGELSLDKLGALWAESQEELLGDAVEVTEGYRTWWSYVPHFLNTPGYVYAYAYGQLLALAVYGRYEEGGPDFAPAYLELLAAGGSKPPEALGEMVGIDLADPGFWDRGLDLVERQLEAAEVAAGESGHLQGV